MGKNSSWSERDRRFKIGDKVPFSRRALKALVNQFLGDDKWITRARAKESVMFMDDDRAEWHKHPHKNPRRRRGVYRRYTSS